MAWTAPRTWVSGELVTAGGTAGLNPQLSQNLLALDAGRVSISSQAAGDVFYASDGNTMARLGADSGKVLVSGSSAPSWSGSPSFTQVDITAEGDLRLQDNTGGEYVGLDAPSSVTTYTLTMPAAIGSVDQALTINNTDGTLQWATVSGTVPKHLCDGRLTGTTNVPVTTADVSGATSIYFTPYTGDQISLYDGSSDWNVRTFTQITISLSGLTASKPYDIFAYDNSGTVTIETLVWTDATTRATALTTQDGVLVKTGATTRRYLGSIYINASGAQTDDTFIKRNIYNYCNRVTRPMRRLETTGSWTYSTATVRQANGSVLNQLEFMQGFDEDGIEAAVLGETSNGTLGNGASVGIGFDSTSAFATGQLNTHYVTNVNNYRAMIGATYRTMPGVGRHLIVWLECPDGGGATTYYGVVGDAQWHQLGITGSMRG